jgi:transcriptional regulator with XRE-family HTH domain
VKWRVVRLPATGAYEPPWARPDQTVITLSNESLCALRIVIMADCAYRLDAGAVSVQTGRASEQMAGDAVRWCRCGTRLARDNPGTRCASCTSADRRRRLEPPAVPPEFWDEQAVRQALTTRDMGALMRAYRTHPYHGRDIPQEIAAGWVGITQPRLSRIENGETVSNITKLIRWAHVLRIPADLLWFQVPGASAQLEGGIEGSSGSTIQEAAWHIAQAPDQPDAVQSVDSGLDDMNRRELLRLVSMATSAVTLASLGEGFDGDQLGHAAARFDAATLDEYAALNSHLWRVFALSQSKAATLPLVRSQFDVLTDGLAHSGSLRTHTRLCTLTADVLQLAGEILFDGNAYTEAAHCYTLAASAAKEAGAYDLWACAMTRHAFIGLYERRGQSAASMLDLASRLARRGDQQLSTRQWVAVVQAQAFAGLGQLDACQRALDVAETVHDLSGPVHTDGWLRFDGSRLPEERGACYVELGRPDLAEAALTNALGQTVSVRRRGAILADLAVTGAQRRDVEQLVTYGTEAVELARQTGSGYIGRKLAGLRPHLASVANDPRVRQLQEQTAALVGAST